MRGFRLVCTFYTIYSSKRLQIVVFYPVQLHILGEGQCGPVNVGPYCQHTRPIESIRFEMLAIVVSEH
jgi:hypothetical protein